MAYSSVLEAEIHSTTARWKNLTNKKMFGGVCYLLKGNMCFGIWKDFLTIRCGEEAAATKLKLKNVRIFDITGKPMKGWVMVAKAAWQKKADLKRWLELGKTFAAGLPPK